MIGEIKRYPAHYLVLALILVGGLTAMFIFRFNQPVRLAVVYATAGLYLLWGIVHHYLVDHLRSKVVLEYFFVALLAVLIINTLI